MKNQMLAKTTLVLSIFGVLAPAARADVFGHPTVNVRDASKAYIVAGIALEEVNAPFDSGSKGYSVTLHTRVGANACVASDNAFSFRSRNADGQPVTSVDVEVESMGQKACRENFAPIYEDLEGYSAVNPGNALRVDTNTVERGVVDIFNVRGAVIEKAAATAVRKLDGNSKWVALQIDATAVLGANPCIAATSRLVGWGYALAGRLHVIVEARTEASDGICTMEYNPVAENVRFDVAYKPGTVKEIVIENSQEPGQQSIFALPTWAP